MDKKERERQEKERERILKQYSQVGLAITKNAEANLSLDQNRKEWVSLIINDLKKSDFANDSQRLNLLKEWMYEVVKESAKKSALPESQFSYSKPNRYRPREKTREELVEIVEANKDTPYNIAYTAMSVIIMTSKEPLISKIKRMSEIINEEKHLPDNVIRFTT